MMMKKRSQMRTLKRCVCNDRGVAKPDEPNAIVFEPQFHSDVNESFQFQLLRSFLQPRWCDWMSLIGAFRLSSSGSRRTRLESLGGNGTLG